MRQASRRFPVTLSLVTLALLTACQQTPQPSTAASEAAGPYSLAQLGEQASTVSAVTYSGLPPAPGEAPPARARVSFIGNSANLPSIGVRQVFLCGQACVALGDSQSVQAPGDATGQGALYADASFAPLTVNRIIVQPDPRQGEVIAFKTIKLDPPLTFAAGERHEVFLTVSSVRRGASQHLQADFLAAGVVSPTAQKVIAYRPDRALQTAADAPYQLQVDAGSQAGAQLLGLESMNTGGLTQRLQVWPPLNTSKPVHASLKVDAKRLPQGLTLTDYRLRQGNGTTTPFQVDADTLNFTTTSLDAAELFTERGVVETDGGQAYAIPSGPQSQRLSALNTDTCKNALISNRAYFESFFTNGSDAIKINVCENTAPFVHIILIDRSKRNRTVALPVTPSVDYPGWYVLRPITSHASGAVAGVNGFTWSGDTGTAYGTGYGQPTATLITAGTVRRTSSATEAMLGFQMRPADLSRGTSAEFFVGASNTLNFGTHGYNVIGSTASIIRNSACSTLLSSEVNRWSAAGIGLNRLVLISSTSSGSSTSAELCSVFEGLNLLNGAIRLDGSTAASMAWEGTHINPITGSNYAIYGSARNIMNALVWK